MAAYTDGSGINRDTEDGRARAGFFLASYCDILEYVSKTYGPALKLAI